MPRFTREELKAGRIEVFQKGGRRLLLSFYSGMYHVELMGEIIGSYTSFRNATSHFDREIKKMTKGEG